MSRARKTGSRRVAGAATALLVATSLAVVGASPAESLTVSPTASFKVVSLGNGHGHGMSQWGAQGAALAGLSTPRILAFYYPHTTLTTLTTRRIRVRLSGLGSRLTVMPGKGLMVTGVSTALPTTGIARYRLVAGTGTDLWLQKLPAVAGAKWVTVRTGLRNRAEFHSIGGAVRVFDADGTTTSYFGYLRAVRMAPSGQHGVFTVNRIGLDRYTAGVVPMEVPTSWKAAAVNAQAVAARTYGAYHMVYPLSSEYDICDTTMCQVYGGFAHYNSAGQLMYRDYPAAATATTNQVLEYGGKPILSQFSASNGGWTVYGGLPYLPAKQDPYDNAASGDPWINHNTKLAVSSIARHFGLQQVTAISVTKRDGNGTWSGRVLAGAVTGTDSTGKLRTVTTTGYDLAGAFGIGTTWFDLRSA